MWGILIFVLINSRTGRQRNPWKWERHIGLKTNMIFLFLFGFSFLCFKFSTLFCFTQIFYCRGNAVVLPYLGGPILASLMMLDGNFGLFKINLASGRRATAILGLLWHTFIENFICLVLLPSFALGPT